MTALSALARGMREEISHLLADAAVSRPPALRRALTDEALFATDLPLCAGEAEVIRLTRRLEEAGWTVRREGGWLLLDRPLALPPDCLTGAGEPAACRSLLARHPGLAIPPIWRRRLLKAAETHTLEGVCWEMHQEIAEELRGSK